jgi:hypothetical protein
LYILIYRSVQIIESSLQEVRLKPDVQESASPSNLSNSSLTSLEVPMIHKCTVQLQSFQLAS